MPASFVKPNIRLIASHTRDALARLREFDGGPLVGHQVERAIDRLASLLITTNSWRMTKRLPVPIGQLWLSTVYASEYEMPNYLPSRWPDIVSNGKTYPIPKLAREWRDKLVLYFTAFLSMVESGEYEAIVDTTNFRTGTERIAERLHTMTEFGRSCQQHV